MDKTIIRRIIALVLMVALVFVQPASVLAMDGGGTTPEDALTATEAVPKDNLTATGTSDWTKIKTPYTNEPRYTLEDRVSTWDCIWFGNYWQEDTNGDGYCFSKDITISKKGLDGLLYDQDGNNVSGYMSEGTYPADDKQPIKWRVLDIDDKGNAMLLSDKFLDICWGDGVDCIWEKSNKRSFLNSYDAFSNPQGKDYSSIGFLNNAFSPAEITAIQSTTVVNGVHPIYGTSGGSNTTDKLFSLSIEEVTTARYGFIANEFIASSSYHYTKSDNTRKAAETNYLYTKRQVAGMGSRNYWGLRTAGPEGKRNAYVYSDGAVYSFPVNAMGIDNIRPAFRMNLSSSSSLWSYAGTVCSDGTVDENTGTRVKEVTLPHKKTINVGESISLIYDINPEKAVFQYVTWKSSDDSVARVDENGVVTGMKGGIAVISIKTDDGGYTADCTVVVNPVTGIYIPQKESVKVGKTVTITPYVTPADAGDKSVTWTSSEEAVATVDKDGTVHGVTPGNSIITATTNDGGFSDFCVVTVIEDETEEDHVPWDNQYIRGPGITKYGFSIWDCVWFGHYWQDTDSNGDGKVTKKDKKDPIKWRVLEISADGDALLLSDRLLDIAEYNEIQRPITWKTSTLRSFLNNYPALYNTDERDYSYDGFLENAFSRDEINAITVSDAENGDNPIFGTAGGLDSRDRVICLSVNEALNKDYGFTKNSFPETNPWENPCTETDYNRIAQKTQYISDRKGYISDGEEEAVWWLRSPGVSPYNASVVSKDGMVDAGGVSVHRFDTCVRPAVRMNLKRTQALWSKAGTVCADGTVSEMNKPVTGISIKDSTTLKVGKSETLIPSVLPADAADRSVRWTTSDAGIASVDENGTVTAKKAGKALVMAETVDGGYTATCTVTVVKPVTGITLPEQESVEVGKTRTLKAEIIPEDATDTAVTWQSFGESVATVDGNGIVTGITPGTAIISAKTSDGGFTAVCIVTVVDTDSVVPATGVSLPENETLIVGNTIKLNAVVTPSDATDRTVTWESSNEDVATVNDNGTVTAVKAGVAVITVKTNDGGYTSVCVVTVSDPAVSVTGVKVTEKAEVKAGQKVQLTATVLPTNAANRKVKWKSLKEAVATVDEDGLVAGVSEGTAVITVRTEDGGYSAYCVVSVNKKDGGGDEPSGDSEDEPYDISLDVDESDRDVTLLPGEVRRLSVSMEGRYIYGVKWEVFFPEQESKGCVSVKNGVITAKNLKKKVKRGKAIVTAKYGQGEPIPFDVTVEAAAPGEKVIIDGKKKYKLTATKTVRMNVGDAGKKVTLGIPANLRDSAKTISCNILTDGVCRVGDVTTGEYVLKEGDMDLSKPSKAGVTITPVDAGATYVAWSVTDDKGSCVQAVTKVFVKKPLSGLIVPDSDNDLTFVVGEGKRLKVIGTKGNTDARDLSFTVNNIRGKGIKVSRSGYVVATAPGCEADITVKSGKTVSKPVTVKVEAREGDYLTLNKISVNMTKPREGKSAKTTPIKLATPKVVRGAGMPEVTYSVIGSPDGIKVITDAKGNRKISVSSDAKPGCYTVTATPADPESGYNTACCEVIVK